MRIGIQTALQDTDVDEVAELWRRAEALGFEWVSGWDHLQGVNGGTSNLDGVVMHTVAATVTRTARVGALTYCIDYRSIGVIAKAVSTIDRLSNGRVTLGLGAGYLAAEYDTWGYRLDRPSVRVARLAETVAALRSLFAGEAVHTEGEHIRLNGAVCDPLPIQQRLPIWIGGGGEQRTIPLAAQVADGWNIPMADPASFARKAALLTTHAERSGRDPRAIERSVNLGLCWDTQRIPEVYGPRAATLRPAILTGNADQIIESLRTYADAGADWVMISLRSPFDLDDIERFAEEILPEVTSW